VKAYVCQVYSWKLFPLETKNWALNYKQKISQKLKFSLFIVFRLGYKQFWNRQNFIVEILFCRHCHESLITVWYIVVIIMYRYNILISVEDIDNVNFLLILRSEIANSLQYFSIFLYLKVNDDRRYFQILKGQSHEKCVRLYLGMLVLV
jgi:hypothetical protein